MREQLLIWLCLSFNLSRPSVGWPFLELRFLRSCTSDSLRLDNKCAFISVLIVVFFQSLLQWESIQLWPQWLGHVLSWKPLVMYWYSDLYRPWWILLHDPERAARNHSGGCLSNLKWWLGLICISFSTLRPILPNIFSVLWISRSPLRIAEMPRRSWTWRMTSTHILLTDLTVNPVNIVFIEHSFKDGKTSIYQQGESSVTNWATVCIYLGYHCRFFFLATSSGIHTQEDVIFYVFSDCLYAPTKC